MAEIDRHLLVEELPPRVVRVTRTDEKFASVLELQSVWTELNRSLNRFRNKGYALLVDTRRAPSRNDADFERVFAPLRTRMFVGFAPCAVLVQSIAGKLQVLRHAREASDAVRVFSDEAEALAYVSHSDS